MAMLLLRPGMRRTLSHLGNPICTAIVSAPTTPPAHPILFDMKVIVRRQSQEVLRLDRLHGQALCGPKATGERPAVPGGVAARASGLDELWGETLHPAVHGDVIHRDTALGEQLFDVPLGQPVPQVPAESLVGDCAARVFGFGPVQQLPSVGKQAGAQEFSNAWQRRRTGSTAETL
jgi:hypothetical protein